MSYRSDIRIRITKDDFEQIKKEFAKYLDEHIITESILDYLDVYKEHEHTWSVLDDETNEWIDKTAPCVYFGWDSMKWYSELEYLHDMIRKLDRFAISIIGEMYDDVQVEYKEFECIEIYSQFVDDCEGV